ncbi:hypothetical protein EVAR_43462_1 [Eumeta japonica]|uniref:Pre-C2HC domain-containing protein n=1 Tax=Eumeta variegata TaxID=151549 RepID=A0A4C1Y9P8_EUMVA|nr:hypothetical protein EVAR_43462_1 [Eumeta japonica]
MILHKHPCGRFGPFSVVFARASGCCVRSRYRAPRGRWRPLASVTGKRISRAISSDEGSEQSDTTVNISEKEQEELSLKFIQWKHKRLVRRLRKSSNESRDSDVDIEPYLERQGYPVLAVYIMRRRDGSALGMFLIILERCDRAKNIFKKLSNTCGLSDLIVEAPYRRGKPGRCHRCLLYGHAAANCHSQPRRVKYLVPHWIKDCNRIRKSGDKPSFCKFDKTVGKDQFPSLEQGMRQSAKTDSNSNPRSAGGDNLCPTPLPPRINGRNRFHGSTGIKYLLIGVLLNLRHVNAGTAASALGENISIISIIQVVRSAEVAELAAKFRKVKYEEDRLRIILENQDLIASNIEELVKCTQECKADIIMAQGTHLKPNRSKACKMKNYAQLQTDSQSAPKGDAVILFGDFNSKSANWNCNYSNRNGRKTKVSIVFEEIDTPILNNIPNDIVSIDGIDNTIDALTNHVRTVVERSSQVVPANSAHKQLPGDVRELIRAKNAVLRRAGKYFTCENRSRAQALQSKVKASS